MMTEPGPLLLNLSLLHTFVPEHLQTGINPSWSLTTELTFYALLPVLAVWLVGRSSRRLRSPWYRPPSWPRSVWPVAPGPSTSTPRRPV